MSFLAVEATLEMVNRFKIPLDTNKINDYKSSYLIYALRASGLLAEFCKRFPDHRAFMMYKKVASFVCVNQTCYASAKSILFSEDNSRGYPSLGEWFINKQYMNPPQVKHKNYTMVNMF